MFSLRAALMLHHCLRLEKIREVCVSVNGHATYKERYPFLVLNQHKLIALKTKAPSYPSEILPQRLYLGDQFHAGD